jgi:surface antigen
VKDAIVVFETGAVGHVAVVDSVNPDGSFVISEMNNYGAAGGGWGRVDHRTLRGVGGNGIAGFIY